MNDVRLIIDAIQASGMSGRRFAERYLTRDERTIRRWISGDQAIPDVARRRLEWFLALPDTPRGRLVALLDRD